MSQLIHPRVQSIHARFAPISQRDHNAMDALEIDEAVAEMLSDVAHPILTVPRVVVCNVDRIVVEVQSKSEPETSRRVTFEGKACRCNCPAGIFGKCTSHVAAAVSHRDSDAGAMESLALVDEELDRWTVPMPDSYAWWKYRAVVALREGIARGLERDSE